MKDHGTPETPEAFLDLADLAEEANHPKGPIVVHCRQLNKKKKKVIALTFSNSNSKVPVLAALEHIASFRMFCRNSGMMPKKGRLLS